MNNYFYFFFSQINIHHCCICSLSKCQKMPKNYQKLMQLSELQANQKFLITEMEKSKPESQKIIMNYKSFQMSIENAQCCSALCIIHDIATTVKKCKKNLKSKFVLIQKSFSLQQVLNQMILMIRNYPSNFTQMVQKTLNHIKTNCTLIQHYFPILETKNLIQSHLSERHLLSNIFPKLFLSNIFYIHLLLRFWS